ncbi:unnamed protein product [Dibothriocephalus latus]|uniref:Innexin n=1 Tax=Dibothriocephalus latus TaxID=60516 RepID=A0A3P6TBC5_DIBLA|nr:unnamed protein product [Dibothriocephalus latus]
MFLEKIFVFLWFWHCIIGIITLFSFFNWFLRMGFARYRLKFIRKFLKIMAVLKDTDKAASQKFVENFLRPDGVFLIRLISMNVGDIIAGDLACELWHIYRHKRMQNTEEMKYIETMPPLPNFLGQQTLGRPPNLPHEEFSVISAPPREKIIFSMSNGNDDSIV